MSTYLAGTRVNAGTQVQGGARVRGGLSVGGGGLGPYQVIPVAGTQYAIAWLAGASYVAGEAGTPILSSSQVNSNVRLVNNDSPHGSQTRALVPLVGVGTLESLLEGSTNQLARRWSPAYTAGLITHHRTVGGTGLGTYVNGQARYATSMQAIDDAVIEAAGSVEYIALLEGSAIFADELAAVSWATTEAALLTLLADWQDELVTRTGQTRRPPMVTYQLGWWQNGATPIAAGYALDQLALALSNPEFIIATPAYPGNVGGDNIHLTNEGYRWLSSTLGEILARIHVDGDTWLPLHAVNATASGNDVILTYSMPPDGGAVQLNTTAYTWRSAAASGTTHGFRYIEGANPARTVTGVVASGNTVTVTLDGAAVAGSELGYADFGAQPPNAASGNVCSQLVTTTADSVEIHWWAAAQRLAIT